MPHIAYQHSTGHFLRVNWGGNCPHSEIKCPHSEHKKQELGGKGKSHVPPARYHELTYLLAITHRPIIFRVVRAWLEISD